MNEIEIKTLLEERERENRNALSAVITKRKTALMITINNLVRDIDNLPTTAQDVKAVYTEIVSKLYTELVRIN